MSLYSQLTPKERFRVEADVARHAKNAGRAYFLALALGAFGAHRLYLGRYATGGAMLLGGLVTVGSWAFGEFSMGAIPGLEIWALVDMLFIQKMLDRQQGELRAKVVERVLGARDVGDVETAPSVPREKRPPKTLELTPRPRGTGPTLGIRGGHHRFGEN